MSGWAGKPSDTLRFTISGNSFALFGAETGRIVVETKQYIRVRYEDAICRITLNRPDIRNAFNDHMITELNQAIVELSHNENIRTLILDAVGSAFCAGADLNWMKRVVDGTFQENLDDATELANLLWAIESLPIPTIAIVKGPAVGGGVGLVAVCDLVLSTPTAWFALSEVKLGLVPAVISPFLLRRMGDTVCRELFLTGRKLPADEARAVGLVNKIAIEDHIDTACDEIIGLLSTSAPKALTACKHLLGLIASRDEENIRHLTARLIAELRVSSEGQEGMKAFLEKRKPSWLTK